MIFIMEEGNGVKGKRNSFEGLEGLLNFVAKPTKDAISIIQKKFGFLAARHEKPLLIIHAETTPGLVRSDFYGKPAIRMDIFSRFF